MGLNEHGLKYIDHILVSLLFPVAEMHKQLKQLKM